MKKWNGVTMFLKLKKLFLLCVVICCTVTSLTVVTSNVPVNNQNSDEKALRAHLDCIIDSIFNVDNQKRPFDSRLIGQLLEKAFESWGRVQNKLLNAGWYPQLMDQACGAISDKFDELFKLLLSEKDGQHYAIEVTKLQDMIEQLMLNIKDRVSGFSSLLKKYSKSPVKVNEKVFQKPFSQEVLERTKIAHEKLEQSDFFKTLVSERAKNILQCKLMIRQMGENNNILIGPLNSKLELLARKLKSLYSFDILKMREFCGGKEFEVLLTAFFEKTKKEIQEILNEVIGCFFFVRKSDVVVVRPTDQEAWGYDINKASKAIDNFEKHFKKFSQNSSLDVPMGFLHIGNEASRLINACRKILDAFKPTLLGSVGEFFGWGKKLSVQEELNARKELIKNCEKLSALAQAASKIELDEGRIKEIIESVKNAFFSKIPLPCQVCKKYIELCGMSSVDAVKKERLALYKERLGQCEYIVEIQNKMIESLPENQCAEYAIMRKVIDEASQHLQECKRLVAHYASFVCSTGKIDNLKTFDDCEDEFDQSFALFKQVVCEFNKPLFTANLCASRKSYKNVEPELILNEKKFGVSEKKSVFSRWILDPFVVNPLIDKAKEVASEKIDEMIQTKLGFGSWKDTVKLFIEKLVNIPDATLVLIGRGLQWRKSLVASCAISLLNYRVSRWFVRAALPDAVLYLEKLDNAGLTVDQVMNFLDKCADLTLGKVSTNDLILQMIEKPASFKIYLKHMMLKMQNVVESLKPNPLRSLSQQKKDEIYHEAISDYFSRQEPPIVMDKKGFVDKWWLLKSLSEGMGGKFVTKNTFEIWGTFAKKAADQLPGALVKSVKNKYFAQFFRAKLENHIAGLLKKLPDQEPWEKLVRNADISVINHIRKTVALNLQNLKNQKKKLDESYSWYHYLWLPHVISYWAQDSCLQIKKEELSVQKKLCVQAIALANVNKKFVV